MDICDCSRSGSRRGVAGSRDGHIDLNAYSVDQIFIVRRRNLKDFWSECEAIDSKATARQGGEGVLSEVLKVNQKPRNRKTG